MTAKIDRYAMIKEFFDSYMKGTNKISLETFQLRLAQMDLLMAEQKELAITHLNSYLIKEKQEVINIQNQLIEAQSKYIAELKLEIARLESISGTSTQPKIVIERQSVETTKPKSTQPIWRG